MGISNKAVLVYLSISQWAGRKIDRRATGEVETKFETAARVGNYTKKLLPAARELELVEKSANSIRKWVSAQTLPWLSDGTRILSAKNYFDFIREFGERKSKFDAAVESFLVEYPKLRTDAQAKLGTLFNSSEYPAEAVLRTKFECVIHYMPVPEVTDFRTEVLESEKESFVAKMRDVETQATRECFTRLQKVIAKAVETLSKPDAIFRDTLLENISDLCVLLPKLNVADDSELDAVRTEVEKTVAAVSVGACRENADERSAAARKLARIQMKVDSLLGCETTAAVVVPEPQAEVVPEIQPEPQHIEASRDEQAQKLADIQAKMQALMGLGGN